jgi:hypothetical protein
MQIAKCSFRRVKVGGHTAGHTPARRGARAVMADDDMSDDDFEVEAGAAGGDAELGRRVWDHLTEILTDLDPSGKKVRFELIISVRVWNVLPHLLACDHHCFLLSAELEQRLHLNPARSNTATRHTAQINSSSAHLECLVGRNRKTPREPLCRRADGAQPLLTEAICHSQLRAAAATATASTRHE